MEEMIKTGKFSSQNITDKTTFFYPENGESISMFFKRVAEYMKNNPETYGCRFVANIDGILIEAKTIIEIIKSGENPEKILEELKIGKKEIDEKYGIVDSNVQDSREIIMLEMACAGTIPDHHSEVTEFAKKQPYHYFVTSSHMGIYDVDQLMQIQNGQVSNYVSDMYDKTKEIIRKVRIKNEINSCIADLKRYLDYLPEGERLKVIRDLYEDVIKPQFKDKDDSKFPQAPGED